MPTGLAQKPEGDCSIHCMDDNGVPTSTMCGALNRMNVYKMDPGEPSASRAEPLLLVVPAMPSGHGGQNIRVRMFACDGTWIRNSE